MNKPTLSILAAAVLLPAMLGAQTPDITGSWQGTLANGGRELRIIAKIFKDDGALKGLFYSIDQGPGGLATGTMTLQGSAFTFTIPGLGGTYQGTLSPDGNAITGTWAQGSTPAPLNLVRATPQTAWAIPEPPPPPKAMAANANPSFEVATIKPSRPDFQGRGVVVRGRQFNILNYTLGNMLAVAYGIHERQIVNAPTWLTSDRFDITGTPDGEGQPSLDQWRVMLQKLLADRFKLAFHREKRELSVYAIIIGKTGNHKLTKSEGNPNGPPTLYFRGHGNLPARNATMAEFAGAMQNAVLDRPVIDQTGITGRYDFTLTWTPDEFQYANDPPRPPAPETNPAPGLFTAIQDQLGLKLETTKAPAEVFVIDKADKPSEN